MRYTAKAGTGTRVTPDAKGRTDTNNKPLAKRWLAAALAATFVLGLGAGVYAKDLTTMLQVRYRDIKVMVDGQEVISDTEPFIVLEEGRVYLGARALAEALGATVDWDDAASTVIVTSGQAATETRSGDKLVYNDPRHRISLSVPGTWERIDNPAVTVAYADPVTASNATLVVTPAEAGATLDAQTDAVMSTIKTLFKVDSISEKAVTTVAGLSARRFELTVTTEGAAVRQQTYVFTAHDQLYVLSFSATVGQFANFESTFGAIRDSVQVQ